MPSLRIHFDSADLARVRVAAGSDPLWELALSVTVLQSRHVPMRYQRWQAKARTQLSTGNPNVVKMLTTLVPPQGQFPDFLTPTAGAAGTLAAALETVAATPLERLGRDLGNVFHGRRVPGWVDELAAGQTAPMRTLIDAMAQYQQQTLSGLRNQIDDVVHADRALRARQVLDGGVEGLLSSLPAPIRWTAPTLQTEYSCERDLYLNGRGLTLIPSYFCYQRPIMLTDPGLPPVLVYPATGTNHPSGDLEGLSALLGRTRAQALGSVRVPCSTSELAKRLNTSIGTASKHATALRRAGLLTSTRHGPTVVHALTSVGEALINRSRDHEPVIEGRRVLR
jgi:DNA-binding transcriptional ArsR family regulator